MKSWKFDLALAFASLPIFCKYLILLRFIVTGVEVKDLSLLNSLGANLEKEREREGRIKQHCCRRLWDL